MAKYKNTYEVYEFKYSRDMINQREYVPSMFGTDGTNIFKILQKKDIQSINNYDSIIYLYRWGSINDTQNFIFDTDKKFSVGYLVAEPIREMWEMRGIDIYEEGYEKTKRISRFKKYSGLEKTNKVISVEEDSRNKWKFNPQTRQFLKLKSSEILGGIKKINYSVYKLDLIKKDNKLSSLSFYNVRDLNNIYKILSVNENGQLYYGIGCLLTQRRDGDNYVLPAPWRLYPDVVSDRFEDLVRDYYKENPLSKLTIIRALMSTTSNQITVKNNGDLYIVNPTPYNPESQPLRKETEFKKTDMEVGDGEMRGNEYWVVESISPLRVVQNGQLKDVNNLYLAINNEAIKINK